VIAFNDNFTINGLQVGEVWQGLAIAATRSTPRRQQRRARYLSDRAKDLDIAKTRGLDVVYKDFDAVLSRQSRANAPARAGYPASSYRPGSWRIRLWPAALPPSDAFPGRLRRQACALRCDILRAAFSEPKLIASPTPSSRPRGTAPPESTPPLPTDSHRE